MRTKNLIHILMTQQNFRSDFIFVETFYSDKDKTRQMPVPEHVRIEYFTASCAAVYVVERNGADCRSCSVSEDGMSLLANIALSRYPVGTGELLKRVVEIVQDPSFPGGEKHIAVPGRTDVILRPGVSDASPQIESSVVMPVSQYGYSAYELAVLNGFDGTESEWLASLQGCTPYDVAVQQGFQGTVSDWLASLKEGWGMTCFADTFNFKDHLSLSPVPDLPEGTGTVKYPDGGAFGSGESVLIHTGGEYQRSDNSWGALVVFIKKDTGGEIYIRNNAKRAIKSVRFIFSSTSVPEGVVLTPDSGTYTDLGRTEGCLYDETEGRWISGPNTVSEVTFTCNGNQYSRDTAVLITNLVIETFSYINVVNAAPAFDLLKTRTRKKSWASHIVGAVSDSIVDYTPCLRFLGSMPGDGWKVAVYIYRNKKNKTFKKVLSADVSQCEHPARWSGDGYTTVVLPWSLMRIFWELFDPDSNTFHSNTYDESSVAESWMTKLRNGGAVIKLNENCSKRDKGPFFSGTFGIRLVNETAGIYGELKRFRIALFNGYSNDSADTTGIAARFTMKIDLSQTVQTFN